MNAGSGHVARAVRDLRPGLVFLENVSALLVRGLAGVAADLAAIGYVGIGAAYEHPMSVPPIGANGSSFSPGLLKTPTAQLAVNGGYSTRTSGERGSRSDAGRSGRASAADATGEGGAKWRHGRYDVGAMTCRKR